MKIKNLIVWVVAFVVVAGVVTTAGLLRAKRPSDKSLEFLAGYSQDKCSMVLIAQGADTVRIKRSGDTWVVAGRGTAQASTPASGLAAISQQTDTTQVAAPTSAIDGDYAVDSASLASMLEKLASMKKDQLVSQNPANQTVFEVDTVAGLLVEVWNDKNVQIGSMRIGKSGPSWSSNYVRTNGSNDVYAVGGSIKYAFFTDRKRWADKTVMKFSKPSAKSVMIAKKGGMGIALERAFDSTGATKWNLTAPEQAPAATDKVEDLLDAVSRLTCLDWETATLADTAMGFVPAELVVTVKLEGGAESVVTVGRKIGNDAKFWVRTSDKPGQTFHVSSYSIERLDKNVGVLKAPPAAPADSAKAAS